MKKFTTFIAILLLCVTALFAQSPEKFSYQAVVRNANNALVTNTSVGMRVSILQGSATGTPVYVETHNSTTNANGLLTVEIGGGNAQQGAFAAINWESGPYFLKTETDPNGGTNYSVTSTQQLLSVPYALYAKEAANSFSGDYNDLTNTPTIPTVPTNVSAFTNDAGYLTGYTETDPQFNAWDKDYNDLINKPQIPTVPTNVSAFNNDVPYLTSEQQILSISNDTIFLTGGSFVKLPAAAVGFSGDYNDLTNKPTIPTVPSNVSAFTNDAGYLTGYTETDPQFNAWNKDYNDLINTPQIPTVPTNVSAFNNDAGYITSEDIPEIPTVPTNVSAFVNDVPYLTSYTEQQVLSISNDTIFLTGGSFVKLPAAAVGFSGDYNDLVNAPEIPTVPTNVSAFNNDAGYLTEYTETDPQFNAWDKDYNDLINTPEIPTVPENVSAFNNDAGYITSEDIPEIQSVPTNVSAFTNDANYITAEDIPEQVNADWEATEGVAFILNKPEIPVVPENVSTFTNDAGYLTNADLLAVINALNARIDSLQNQLDNGGGQGGSTPSHHDDFENAQLPTVVTLEPVNNISQTTAQVNIMVLSDGGGVISQVGVCYDTTATPTVANDHIGGAWIGSNSATYQQSFPLYPLIPGKTYYARAYATNNKGTAYGDVVTFTTLIAEQTYGEPCPEAATVTDIDGNEYNTVQIGEQCWMRESLRTTHTPSGEEIPLQNGRSIPSGGMSRVATAGYLYTYSAAMNGASSSNTVPSGVQGICPDGWHLPSNAEWQILHDYASNQTDWLCGNGYYGKALAAATEWSTSTTDCALGNNMLENNKSGFTALTTEYLHCSGYVYLSSTGLSIYNYTSSGSVRCLRNYITSPVIQLTDITKLSPTSVKTMSEITDTGGELLARGVCWGTESEPTVDGNHTTDNVTAGLTESIISELEPGTTYYFRAYATNSTGTVYSNQLKYHLIEGSDGAPCPNAETVTDIDNNTYNTVQIGTQCWMKENLKTTKYPDGSEITLTTGSTSYSTGYRLYPNNNSSNVSTYGYLYNWAAMMNGAASSNMNPSGVQGICPDGWHVPSDAEWTQLKEYVSSSSQFVCNGNSDNIAKALAGIFGWTSYDTDCTVGNEQSTNNATGLSLLPAGYMSNGSFLHFGEWAEYWSATNNNASNSNTAWYYDLDYRYPNVYRAGANKSNGYSVRCLKGGSVSATISTSAATNITSNSATLNGTVSGFNNDSENFVGFEWKAAGDSTYTTVTADGVSEGNFSYDLTGLAADSTYTYRAFMSVDGIKYYGLNTTLYTSFEACPDRQTVADIDNNVYPTIQIGNQCWIKENLRTTHYSNGTALTLSSTNYPNGNIANVATYGILYDWSQVMHGAASSDSNPSGVQGICPAGWHVPSSAEWTQMMNYVSSRGTTFTCEDYESSISKALASNVGWMSSNGNCTVGYDLSTNNATGFNLMPAGSGSSYSSSTIGQSACLWSSTSSNNGSSAWYLYVENSDYAPGSSNRNVSNTQSVRCIHDGNEGGEAVVPTIHTYEATNITFNSATLNGAVSNPDNGEVISMGFEWKIDNATDYTVVSVPVIANGPVSHTLDGLTANTEYIFRTFITTADNTDYGEVFTFKTNLGPCPGSTTVTDVDNNVYPTILIGNQCWMAENLRTTHYSNGADIPAGTSTSNSVAYRYNPNDDASTVSNYGYLYNWPAVMHNTTSSSANPSGVQGVCPEGWHVPSHAEWTQMEDYVNSQSQFRCGGNSGQITRALSLESEWDYLSSLCETQTKSVGFNAIPAGYYSGYHGYFGSATYFWSSSSKTSTTAYVHGWESDETISVFDDASRGYAMSVRCIRDSVVLPTVTTSSVTQISATSVIVGGEVIQNGGGNVTHGVCWGTSPNPGINGNHTDNGTGFGTFTCGITGLTSGTTYYFRAYVKVSTSIAYGNQVEFTMSDSVNASEGLPQSCQGTPIVIDYDGNVYNTVQIGDQCWMKENLRVKHYADGTALTLGNDTSSVYAYYYYANGDADNTAIYGLQYNWKAAMGESASSNTNPSGTQGICPAGWHLPSNAEWNVLRGYVSSAEFVCDGVDENAVGKSVASTQGWNTSDTLCDIGYQPENNNLTGFSAYPAGETWYSTSNGNRYSNPLFFGERCYFWSSTLQDDTYVYSRLLYHDTPYFYRTGFNRKGGISVRCLRGDAGGGETSATLPTVTTATVSDITETTATCGGEVTNDGGATVTVRGVCWSTSQNPTLSDSYTTDGNGTGAFNSSITGLTANTTYYVRAYATNSAGTAYGSEQSFTTSSNPFFSLPTITTATVSDITETTATCGGEVTADGGAAVTARGVCWSTSQNPTLSDSYTTDGNGTGAFNSNITGLTANTTYYVRAYATNSAGTAYGSEQSFTTSAIPTIDTCYLLNENFDNGAIPAGWTTFDNDMDGYIWSHNSSTDLSSSLGHDGSSGFMTSASYMNNIGALTPDNWLISPAVTITNIATLSFWVKPQDANYRSEHYGVYVTTSNDYTNSDNYTLLFDETITQSGWEQKTVSLQDYAGQTVHIAFRHFNCSDWYFLNLDDVTIQYDCSTDGQ
ncbi:MAG: choice-of-anchor J domain-containing protein [Bacteroidales bacterium]|nr:choice-of-anchor J domain-containing protein [Bacteroidales bacterium]